MQFTTNNSYLGNYLKLSVIKKKQFFKLLNIYNILRRKKDNFRIRSRPTGKNKVTVLTLVPDMLPRHAKEKFRCFFFTEGKTRLSEVLEQKNMVKNCFIFTFGDNLSHIMVKKFIY